MLPSTLWGSSPHMRGTPVSHHSDSRRHGIIPAYAGNTQPLCKPLAKCGDHPRICGEHKGGELGLMLVEGSSPHMRGTPCPVTPVMPANGIIPAYAGNTPIACWRSPPTWDHPRICGEHRRRHLYHASPRGSSPHMRGTLNVDTVGSWNNGDHPRICGEHGIKEYIKHGYEGSSPHMRGTLGCIGSIELLLGIIPAYAGNTGVPLNKVFHIGDHPRICGEHGKGRARERARSGSSPHMRGTLSVCAVPYRRRGIIPAYAGNTIFQRCNEKAQHRQSR